MKQSRQKISISALVGLKFLRLQPQDWVYVTNERMIFDQKTFQAMAVELVPIGNSENPTLAVRLSLREIASSVHNYLTADYETPVAGNTDLAMGHVTNVGNVNVIDDNISQIGGVDGNDASVSGTTLTTLGAFTINSCLLYTSPSPRDS